MKTLAALLAFIYSVPALAAVDANAEAKVSPGLYAYAHEIAFMGDFSARECREAQGRWTNGHCLVPVSDTVVIERQNDGWAVAVDTITTNGHSCELKGTAEPTSEGLLAVSGAGEGCRLAIQANGAALSVHRVDDAACTELCASVQGLDITLARKLR